MRTTILLILIGLFFLFSLTSQFAAMYTYWWFAIFRPHEWAWSGELKALKVTTIAALLFFGHALLHRKIPKLNNSISFLILAFLALETISNFIVGCADVYTVRTRTLVELYILGATILISAEIIEKKEHLYWLITVIALSIGFHSGKGGIYALLTGANFYGASNLTGLFSGSNAFALGTGILIFFMIIGIQCIKYIDLSIKSKIVIYTYQTILVIMTFGSFYNIIALSSRGSFFGTAAGLILWMVLHDKRNRILTAFFITISLLLTIVPLPSNYSERLASAFADKDELDHSASSRPHFWATAFEIAKDHPLGVGPGCFPPFYNDYDTSDGFFGYYRSVHSSHFQVLADTGFLGVTIWVLLHIVSLKKLWAVRRQSLLKLESDNKYKFYFHTSNALICSIIVFLIGGSFYEYAYNDLIWLIWGLAIASERLFKNEFNQVS